MLARPYSIPLSLFHFLAVTSFALVVQNKSLSQHSVVWLVCGVPLQINAVSCCVFSCHLRLSQQPCWCLFLLLAPWFYTLILFYFYLCPSLVFTSVASFADKPGQGSQRDVSQSVFREWTHCSLYVHVFTGMCVLLKKASVRQANSFVTFNEG